MNTNLFLNVIWGNGSHAVAWTDADGRFGFTHIATPGDMPPITRMQGHDFWISAHPLDHVPAHGRGTSLDVAEVVAIPADLDWAHDVRHTEDKLPTEKEVRARLKKLGPELAPSIVVQSGHGLQVWWLLSRPLDAEEGQAMADAITAKLAEVGLDNGRPDIASIMRLPGTRNHKDPENVVDVVIESGDAERVFTPEFLWKRLPTPKSITDLSQKGTKHRTGSVTDAQQDLVNFLIEQGGHTVRVWSDGSVHVTRPGKPAREGSSASIITGAEGDALLTIFTDRWPGLLKGSYIQGIDGGLHHPSDPTATFTIEATPATEVPRNPGNLPDEFWNARPWLTSLREWSHSRMTSADTMYGAVRARLSVLAPHNLAIETGIGTPISLNSLTGMVGEPGAGKTTSLSLAAQVVGFIRDDIFEGSLGSGEGLIEAYFDWVMEENEDTGKAVKVRRQVKNGALFTLDEGEALQGMGSRGGTTLLPTIRSAWSGAMLGQTNASAETRRQLSPGEYRLAMIAGFQKGIAAELLADHATGTPQRFVLFNANDPGIPADMDEVPMPEPLKSLPRMTGGVNFVNLATSVRKEVRARRHAIQTGRIKVGELDVHRDSNRLKEAAYLALMDGRLEISEEDWHLAGYVMDTSDELRRQVIELAATKAATANLRRGVEDGERKAAATVAKDTQLVTAMAARIVQRLPADGAPVAWRTLSKALTSGATRDRFGQAVELLVQSGRVGVIEWSKGKAIHRIDVWGDGDLEGGEGEEGGEDAG